MWATELSLDGTRLVSVSHDETIRWWDTMTGEQLKIVKNGHTCTIYSVSLSEDGTLLATASVRRPQWDSLVV